MEEVIRKICKFEDGFTNAIACLIVADMFMGNTISKKQKQQDYGRTYIWRRKEA